MPGFPVFVFIMIYKRPNDHEDMHNVTATPPSETDCYHSVSLLGIPLSYDFFISDQTLTFTRFGKIIWNFEPGNLLNVKFHGSINMTSMSHHNITTPVITLSSEHGSITVDLSYYKYAERSVLVSWIIKHADSSSDPAWKKFLSRCAYWFDPPDYSKKRQEACKQARKFVDALIMAGIFNLFLGIGIAKFFEVGIEIDNFLLYLLVMIGFWIFRFSITKGTYYLNRESAWKTVPSKVFIVLAPMVIVMVYGIAVFVLMSDENIDLEIVVAKAFLLALPLFIKTTLCILAAYIISTLWNMKTKLYPLQDRRPYKPKRKRTISCIETRLRRISHKKSPSHHQCEESNEVRESTKSGETSIGVPS